MCTSKPKAPKPPKPPEPAPVQPPPVATEVKVSANPREGGSTKKRKKISRSDLGSSSLSAGSSGLGV